MKSYTQELVSLVNTAKTRAQVVPLYADAILWECYARPPQATTEWHSVNDAIMRRWSVSALIWIKQRAWKRADTMAAE